MVVDKTYTPKRGDIVWVNFQPQSGKEQSGRRPAIVLSNSEYNRIVGLAIFCPITSKVKGFPFEVALPKNLPISGVVLDDQIRNLDWKSRNVEYISTIDTETIEKILGLIKRIIEIE